MSDYEDEFMCDEDDDSDSEYSEDSDLVNEYYHLQKLDMSDNNDEFNEQSKELRKFSLY